MALKLMGGTWKGGQWQPTKGQEPIESGDGGKQKSKTKSSQVIPSVINYLEKQIGIRLKPDTYFSGLSTHNKQKYFSVEMPGGTDVFSSNLNKLKSFANQYGTIRVEPAGVKRVNIFLLKDPSHYEK